MPLIHVTMIEGRSKEQKQAMLTAITQAVQDTVGASLDSIRVWITDVPGDEYMAAGALASDREESGRLPGAAADPLDGPPAEAPGTPPAPPVDPILASGPDRLL